MRKYAIEEYDIDFKDFGGIGELVEAVYEIEEDKRNKATVALVNHIRLILKETKVLGLSTGTMRSSGDRFIRVSVFDEEPRGTTYPISGDDTGRIYIEIED